jgi:hypothetical protein
MNSYSYMTGTHDVRSRKGFYIGASDISTIIGLTKTTPYQWWREHTGRDPAFAGNSATYWGHELEGLVLKNAIWKEAGQDIAQRFFLDYSRNQYKRRANWQPKTAYEPFTECIHPDFPWMLAHADCVYNPGDRLIEAKSGGFFGNVRRDDMDGYDRTDPTASGLPFKVFFQAQWQAAVYGCPHVDVAALINTNDFSTYQVDANGKIQARLIEAGSRMMYCLTNDVAPTPKTFGDIKKLFPELNDMRLTVMGERAAIAWELKERMKKARALEKRGKTQKEDITAALALLLGDHVELADEMGKKICSQSIFPKLTMLSPKKIKDECPDAYDLLDAAGLIESKEQRRINV